MECSGIILISINVLFLILGLAILVMGIVFQVNFAPIKDALVNESGKTDFNLDQAGSTLAIGLIVLGVIIILVALLGCSGACCKSRILLVVYALIVIVILIAEIVVVILAVVKGKDAENVLKEGLFETLEKYKPNGDDARSKAVNAIWSTFECCGVNNWTDFKSGSVPDFKFPTENKYKEIPVGCCKNVNYELGPKIDYNEFDACLKAPTADNAYIGGCYTELKDTISHYSAVAIGVGVFIFVIEIVVVLAAFCLCCRSEDYKA